jgi:hypothetical protein
MAAMITKAARLRDELAGLRVGRSFIWLRRQGMEQGGGSVLIKDSVQRLTLL